jgi:hypothetical protein
MNSVNDTVCVILMYNKLPKKTIKEKEQMDKNCVHKDLPPTSI